MKKKKTAEELRAACDATLAEPEVINTAAEFRAVMDRLHAARCEGAPESVCRALARAAGEANRRAGRALNDAYARHGV